MVKSLIFRPHVVLLAVCLLCHGLLPFTDYVIWDDLWLINWLQNGRTDWLWRTMSECGIPGEYYYFLPFSVFGDIVLGAKVVGLICAFTIASLVHAVSKKTGLLEPVDCLILAVVTITLPAYKYLGGVVYAAYVLPIIVLLAGVLAALYAQDQEGWRHGALRWLALTLLMASFVMASILVFYGSVFWLLVLVRQRQLGVAWYQIPWGHVLKNLDFLSLPFVFWALRRTCWPTHGYYAGLNEPTLRLDWFLQGYETMPEVLTDPFTLAFHLSRGWRLAILALFAILLPVLYFAFRFQTPAEPATTPAPGTPSPKWALGLFAFGLVGLFFATLPYVLVGRTFGPYSLNTTYTALMPIPVGLLCIALCQLLGRAMRCPVLVRTIAFSALLAVWLPTWWHNYLSLQALQVRNDAIVHQYHQNPLTSGVAWVRIVNETHVARTPDFLAHWLWTYTECGVTGQPRSIALNEDALLLPKMKDGPIPADEGQKYLERTTIPYALTMIDVEGGRAEMRILPGPGDGHPLQTGSCYLYCKWFAPTEIGSLYRSLVRIEITPSTTGAYVPPLP